MKSFSKIRISAALSVAIVLAGLPGWASLRQVEVGSADAPPEAPFVFRKPGERACCSLGVAKGMDPARVANAAGAKPMHVYGNESTVSDISSSTASGIGETVGYIYTAAAGLVDIGHVRDNADTVRWVYANLMHKNHTFTVRGDDVGVVNIPTTKDQVLALAGSIAFVNSWAHELQTWGDTTVLNPAEDYSAFSPEDLSSNIVGIKAGTRAIQSEVTDSDSSFNQQMDATLTQMMKELGAQEKDKTDAALDSVKAVAGGTDLTGKWWMYDPESAINGFVRLLRRNFDGKAWKIAQEPTADTPDWLKTDDFNKLYPQFLYYMTTYVDATQVPQTSAYAVAPAGSRPLEWKAILPAPIPSAGNLADALGGGTHIVDTSRKPLTSGQFATVRITTYTPPTTDILGRMQDATNAIRGAFVALNKGMDGP
jgi:Protein of unknown function (DUF4056)